MPSFLQPAPLTLMAVFCFPTRLSGASQLSSPRSSGAGTWVTISAYSGQPWCSSLLPRWAHLPPLDSLPRVLPQCASPWACSWLRPPSKPCAVSWILPPLSCGISPPLNALSLPNAHLAAFPLACSSLRPRPSSLPIHRLRLTQNWCASACHPGSIPPVVGGGENLHRLSLPSHCINI